MAFKFPFTNYHELNLTWVLEQLKKLFEESNENVETIESYENRLSAVETELPTVEATAEQAETVANAAASLAQTAKSTADTANENALTASAQAGLARQEAATAGTEAQAATQAAQQAQATAQNFDGRITQAEADASEALQEAQSFENRVNAAINTANNAANTATIAQGIAVNANQNAATALDTAQTADGKAEAAQDAAEVADDKAEAAQDAADIADGKAEAAQDAADIADGKAEAAQDAADIADGKATQNAANIGNLANLTTTAKNNLVAAINEAAQSGGSGDNTNCAPIIISTASGVVASFSDGANNRKIRKIVGSIVPIQSGAGVPSPDNIRLLSGWTGANIYNEETYDASATPKITIIWQNEAGTIYGGSITLNEDGSIDVVDNYIFKIETGSGVTSYSGARMRVSAPGFSSPGSTTIADIKASYLQTTTKASVGASNWEISASDSGRAELLIKFTSSINTVTLVKEYLAENPLQILYKRATPLTYHFDDIGQIYTFFGVNNVWIDTGAITECNYPADTKLYIDEKVAELQALILEN